MCRLQLLITVFTFLMGLSPSADAACPVPEASSAAISALAHVEYPLGISAGDEGTRDIRVVGFDSLTKSMSTTASRLLTVRRPINDNIMIIVEIAGRSDDCICLGDNSSEGSSISQIKVNDNVLLLRISEPVNLSANSHDSCILTLITTDN